jgi:ADP-ribosylglycohydrolase
MNTDDYRSRLMGCWLGKAVGGTLGQTFEGLQGPLDASFYLPVPTEMVPNDDLDLQVLFACVLSQSDEPLVDRQVLANAWRDHVAFPWNEYGVGLRNLGEGIRPPFTGSFDNWFTCGEGAAIRSELWACLAPGNPDLAAAYAYEDACFDHAGDGIVAEVFLARLESAAFEETDPDRLIDLALTGIPQDSGIHSVVTRTRQWVREGLSWVDVRARIMSDYGRSDFTDVRPNTGFVILGWLAGSNFSERILICNNCGQDTDSSTASLGALLGILDPDAIEQRWLEPIGRNLVLNKEIIGIEAPPTIDGFTDLVVDLAARLNGAAPVTVEVDFDPDEHRIPVEIGHFNTAYEKWTARDLTELPPPGSSFPVDRVNFESGHLPGTWVRWPREQFHDELLAIHYRMDAGDHESVRLMFNCSEHFRVWLDGRYLLGAQGSQYMFPAPHMAPLGHSLDIVVEPGTHDLVVAVRRPPEERPEAEWIIGLVERPSNLWIANAFRPEAGR